MNIEREMTRMKTLRIAKGLRQIDVSIMADISMSWVWHLENGGERRTSFEVKKNVALALGVQYEDLFEL